MSLPRLAFLAGKAARMAPRTFATTSTALRELPDPASSELTSSPKASTLSKELMRDFMAVFPDVVRDLTFQPGYADVPSVNKHLAKCIQYNVPGGKKSRGPSVPLVFKLLAAKEEQNEDNLRLSNVLGWCVEIVSSSS